MSEKAASAGVAPIPPSGPRGSDSPARAKPKPKPKSNNPYENALKYNHPPPPPPPPEDKRIAGGKLSLAAAAKSKPPTAATAPTATPAAAQAPTPTTQATAGLSSAAATTLAASLPLSSTTTLAPEARTPSFPSTLAPIPHRPSNPGAGPAPQAERLTPLSAHPLSPRTSSTRHSAPGGPILAKLPSMALQNGLPSLGHKVMLPPLLAAGGSNGGGVSGQGTPTGALSPLAGLSPHQSPMRSRATAESILGGPGSPLRGGWGGQAVGCVRVVGPPPLVSRGVPLVLLQELCALPLPSPATGTTGHNPSWPSLTEAPTQPPPASNTTSTTTTSETTHPTPSPPRAPRPPQSPTSEGQAQGAGKAEGEGPTTSSTGPAPRRPPARSFAPVADQTQQVPRVGSLTVSEFAAQIVRPVTTAAAGASFVEVLATGQLPDPLHAAAMRVLATLHSHPAHASLGKSAKPAALHGPATHYVSCPREMPLAKLVEVLAQHNMQQGPEAALEVMYHLDVLAEGEVDGPSGTLDALLPLVSRLLLVAWPKWNSPSLLSDLRSCAELAAAVMHEVRCEVLVADPDLARQLDPGAAVEGFIRDSLSTWDAWVSAVGNADKGAGTTCQFQAVLSEAGALLASKHGGPNSKAALAAALRSELQSGYREAGTIKSILVAQKAAASGAAGATTSSASSSTAPSSSAPTAPVRALFGPALHFQGTRVGDAGAALLADVLVSQTRAPPAPCVKLIPAGPSQNSTGSVPRAPASLTSPSGSRGGAVEVPQCISLSAGMASAAAAAAVAEGPAANGTGNSAGDGNLAQAGGGPQADASAAVGVRSVGVCDADVRDAGASALGLALREGARLEVVDLSGNRAIGEPGWRSLSRGIQASTCLVSLRLRSCELGPSAAPHIAHALRTCASLKEVNLAGNRNLAPAVSQVLEAMTVGGSGLKRLSLAGCPLDPAATSSLSALLRSSSSLAHLDLSACDLKDAGVTELCAALDAALGGAGPAVLGGARGSASGTGPPPRLSLGGAAGMGFNRKGSSGLEGGVTSGTAGTASTGMRSSLGTSTLGSGGGAGGGNVSPVARLASSTMAGPPVASSSSSGLVRLRLSSNGLGAGAAVALGRVLSRNARLQHLALDANPLLLADHQAAVELMAGLGSQVGAGLSLATLDISHTGLGASALGEFVRRLGAGAMSLRELRLAGVVALGAAPSQLSQGHSLLIQELAAAVRSNVLLEVLDLSGCELGDGGCNALVDELIEPLACAAPAPVAAAAASSLGGSGHGASGLGSSGLAPVGLGLGAADVGRTSRPSLQTLSPMPSAAPVGSVCGGAVGGAGQVRCALSLLVMSGTGASREVVVSAEAAARRAAPRLAVVLS